MSEEIKNEFINCIEGTHTLNLAVSILEERDLYQSIIKEAREYIETHLDNTFKSEFDYITTNPQELLEILDKVNNVRINN